MVQTPAATRWAAIVERHNASGKTIAQFALDNELNPHTLAYWRSKLNRAQQDAPQRKVAIKVLAASAVTPRWPIIIMSMTPIAV